MASATRKRNVLLPHWTEPSSSPRQLAVSETHKDEDAKRQKGILRSQITSHPPLCRFFQRNRGWLGLVLPGMCLFHSATPQLLVSKGPLLVSKGPLRDFSHFLGCVSLFPGRGQFKYLLANPKSDSGSPFKGFAYPALTCLLGNLLRDLVV